MKCRLQYFVLCIAITLLTTGVPGAWAQTEIITFVYPPYTVGDGSGILEQIVDTVSKETSIRFSLLFYPRARAKIYFEEKKAGALFLGERSYFPSLSEELESLPLLHFRTVFVYIKKRFPEFEYTALSDLKGRYVGITLGSIYTEPFKKAGLIIDNAPLEKQIVKLVKGRIDFWHTVDVTAINMIEEYYPERSETFSFIEETNLTAELVVTKNSSVKQAYKKFCDSFNSMKKNGTYLKILEEYYGKGLVPDKAMVQ